MKARCGLLVLGLAGVMAASATAGILDFKVLAIDFTNAADAGAKAVWSEPDKLTVTTNGLGWDGEPAASRDGWIQTKPLALGLSWRPPYAVTVNVRLDPEPAPFVLNNGQTSSPYAGDVYVRYSPDLLHWSTWQALQSGAPRGLTDDKPTPGRRYSGAVRVPYVAREAYGRLLAEYARLDVPWKSDEEAAVRWILEKDPAFFAREIPFIGYVEFRFEAGFHGGRRITAFRAEVSYGMSGIHSAPRDRASYEARDSIPWSFKAEPVRTSGSGP